MKKLLLLSFFIAVTIGVQAQNSLDKLVKKDAKHFVKVLKLDKVQKIKMQDILSQKYKNLDAISALEKEDHALYRSKRRAIYSGMDGSIRLILNREQIDLFDVEKRRQRLVNAEKIQQLQAKGADVEDIMDAQFGIH